jgi:small-conductance mechanosensitive channel
MRRTAPLLAALIALILLTAPAPAQVMSWWLGGSGGSSSRAEPGMTETISWWLGAGGGAADPQGGVAQTVSWWLGATGGEGGSQPVQASQTLSWWLGTSAQAENDGAAPSEPAEGVAPDYAAWEGVAADAEAAIENPETPNFALEQLRGQLAAWRERFLTAQNANRTRIDTIRNQISALGPPPEEGVSETPEIAQRRRALNGQLATLQAPGIAAEEAYLRADGLIREIDTILRERQAHELLELGPSPLVPLNWPPAFAVLTGLGADLWREAREGWASTTSRANARENLPATIFFLLLGAGLLWRGRRWSERLAQRLLSGPARRAKRVVLALLVSLGQVILPVVGIVLLVTAAVYTELVGPRGRLVLDALPMMGFVVLAARWLGQQVFARDEAAALLPGLGPERRAEGRFYSMLLGLLLALAGLLTTMVPYEGDTLTARAVLGFPVLLLGGLILVRMGQILIGAARAGGEAAASTRGRLLFLIGRAAVLLGILGPTLAAIGYFTAGRFLVFPAALSLALLAFLVILQQLAADLYAFATGRGEEEEEALVPVLIGFALALLALPVLALIWGARVSDLTELWTRAREGFAFGDTRIAPADFLTFAAVFALGYLATRLVQGALKTSLLPKTRLDPGGQNAIVSGTGYLGIFLAAVVAITSAGIDLSNLAIVAGALSVGIGFGLQNIVSNFISGIILLIERPISEGDWIEVGGQMGYVRDISVRSTRIETFDRTDVIVPNSELISGVVTNYTRGNLTGRIIVRVGVAYGSDTKRVEEILREIAEEHPLVTLNPKPAILFVGFGADSLDFEIRAILRDVNFSMATKSEMNHEIARRFAEEGIEIPFAQRDIWLRNPEALSGAKPSAPKKRKRAKPGAGESIDPALRDLPADEDDEA